MNIIIPIITLFVGFALGFLVAALCNASHRGQADAAGIEMYECLQAAIRNPARPDQWAELAQRAMTDWMEA